MVRRRADRVRTLRDHARLRDFLVDLLARQVPADARLGPLPHLDLDGGSAVEVLGAHAKASRGHLHDDILGIRVEIGVQTALTGVHEGAQALCGHRERAVHVERDRAVAHRREDDGGGKLDVLGDLITLGQLETATAVCDHLDGVGLAAQVSAQLHRLAERIDRGVGDLARVEHEVVEDVEVGLVVAHAGQHDAARLGLTPDGLAQPRRPVVVVTQREVVLLDGDAVRGAIRHAAVARAALGIVRDGALVERVDVPPALLHAAATLVALVVVDVDLELGLYEGLWHLSSLLRSHRLRHRSRRTRAPRQVDGGRRGWATRPYPRGR